MQYTASIHTTSEDGELDSFSVAVFETRDEAYQAVAEAILEHALGSVVLWDFSVKYPTATWTTKDDPVSMIGHIKPTVFGEWTCNP